MRYVGLKHIEPHTMRVVGHGEAHSVRSSSLQFSRGDVLYGRMRPYLNKVWVAEFDGLCSSEFLVFPKRDGLNNHFLAACLNAEDFVKFANERVSGERPRVDFKRLSPFPILLPPTKEQGRIVGKMNAALLRVARAEGATRRALEGSKNYRASVLRAATSGDLTRGWRETHQKEETRTAATGRDLLVRLLAARRALWGQSEFGHLRSRNKDMRDNKRKDRYVEPKSPDVKSLTDLPVGWVWTRLEQLGFVIGGLTKNPARTRLRRKLPYLRVTNVYANQLRLDDVATIGVGKTELNKLLLEKGDLLVVEGNGSRDQIGRLAIWDGSIKPCVHQNHIIKVRLVEKELAAWILSWLLCPDGRFHIERVASSTTGLYTLSMRKVGNLPIPLPPPAERAEIDRKLKDLLPATDRLAERLDRQLKRSGALRRSLLREALAGRLVPQDPEDEPASTLLKQLRIERDRSTAKKSNAQRRSPGPLATPMENPMKLFSLTPETLTAAFGRIGQQADARRLFDETGCGPDQVTTFYATLRTTPTVREAFERGRDTSHRRRRSAPMRQTPGETGRFRMIEVWLDAFKNLEDYSVRFDPAHGLDVVLGWNGTGKSNLFEALVIIFRDLHEWSARNRWPEEPMNAYRVRYEIDDRLIEVVWNPTRMRRPSVTAAERSPKGKGFLKGVAISRADLPLPHFVFGYYSGPTNRLAEHFQPMKQAHYTRLLNAKSDDPNTLSDLLEQRRFFCAETHHAKYVLLAFCYRKDPEISRFLRERLRITGFESALFVIRRPDWAKPGAKASDFWGARGVMRRVMERLRDFSIAPMVIDETVSDGYRTSKEDHYYFFLPDLSRLHAFADEYDDARTFFLALESTDFSELIHDVKILVRVSSTTATDVPITFQEMSEGEQQLLMVLGLMRFTKSHQSLVLLDEPDTHLNPHWSVDYLKLLTRVMSDGNKESDEQQTSQILVATHDPLVIASLVKEQVHLLKRDSKTGRCKCIPAGGNPRGLGFTGILTSDMFGFRSDLDEETLADLDDKARLMAREEDLRPVDAEQLGRINERLGAAGFLRAFSDPYYTAFVRAWGQRYSKLMAGQQFLTDAQRQEIKRVARDVLAEAVAEVEKEAAG